MKRRPTMALTIQWSVAAVGPMPTPKLISQSGRDIQVDGGEDLLLLIVQAGDRGDATVVGIVLHACRSLFW